MVGYLVGEPGHVTSRVVSWSQVHPPTQVSSQPLRCRSFYHSTVTARCHSLSSLGQRVMAGRVGRSRANFNEQILVQHPFQVPLQAATIDGRAERLEIPNGQPAVLEKIAQRFALALVQTVLFHQRVAADGLLAHLAHPVGGELRRLHFRDQNCPLCGGNFLHDGYRAGLFFPKHPDQRANGRFRVQFGRGTRKRFSFYREAERFLTGLRWEGSQDSGGQGKGLTPQKGCFGFIFSVYRVFNERAPSRVANFGLISPKQPLAASGDFNLSFYGAIKYSRRLI